jgi:hypothetical protein
MRFHTSNPDPWTMPRQRSDASQRFRIHGPIQPMESEPGFFKRLFSSRLH